MLISRENPKEYLIGLLPTFDRLETHSLYTAVDVSHLLVPNAKKRAARQAAFEAVLYLRVKRPSELLLRGRKPTNKNAWLGSQWLQASFKHKEEIATKACLFKHAFDGVPFSHVFSIDQAIAAVSERVDVTLKDHVAETIMFVATFYPEILAPSEYRQAWTVQDWKKAMIHHWRLWGMETLEPEEDRPHEVDASWSLEDLLNQQGLFYLKDIMPLLPFTPSFMNRLRSKVQDPFVTMGVRQVRDHRIIKRANRPYVVDMNIFSDFLLAHFPSCSDLPNDPDMDELIKRGGIYDLQDLLQAFDIKTSSFHYYLRRCENPKTILGVWKNRYARTWYVDLAIFGPYLRDYLKNQSLSVFSTQRRTGVDELS